MSIQIPTTEFKYDGKIFQLVVSIGTAEDILLPVDFEDHKKYQMLANENLEMLEFTNELNQLCMTGSLIYKDVEGYVTDFINRTNTTVIVDLRRILTQADGDISIKNTDDANKFYHEFLVNNIEILDRDGGIITYKLYMISINFNALVKTLHYSNYNKDPEKITDMLKSLLKRAAEGFGEQPLYKIGKQFEEDECTSNVKMHYTTNGNDNMLTIAKFLLSKMFYFQLKSSESRDESIKFLYYDQYENAYNMFDLAKIDLTKASNDKIILSMFKTTEEHLTYESDNQIATVISFPHSRYKKLVFGTHTYDYQLLHNTIIQEYVTQKTLTDYHDKTDSQNTTEVESQTKPKEDPKNPDYTNQQPYWNNSYTIYQTMVESLLTSNSLVIDTGPNVRRMPSNSIFISIPPDKSNVTTDSQKDYESVAGRYGQMQGLWIIGKVRNIIQPAKSVYRQNLVLFKNFFTKKEVAN